MRQCVELLNRETEADFIDINLGCPIDMVFNKGQGSGCFQRPGRLAESIKGITAVCTL
jgi:tRNA-dihydrouridine synthase 3